jgi:hypothetical protein
MAKIRHLAIKAEDQEKTAASVEANSDSYKKPRDGRFAEMGVQDPVGQMVDVTVHGWKA